MRKTWGIAVVVLFTAACRTESATPPPMAAPPTTPEYTFVPPTRKPAPAGAAEQLVGVERLPAPDKDMFPPPPGQAQVIFSCDYESGSPQWSASGPNRQNPPGESRGKNGGDVLSPGTHHNSAKVFGSQGEDVSASDFYAPTYTQDSWPVQKVVTSYRVQRERLTKANVMRARNEYAKGCAYQGWFDPRTVSVSVYAPWGLGF
jgi:hypothetical protein